MKIKDFSLKMDQWITMHDLKKLRKINNPPNKNINEIHNSPKKELKCDSCGHIAVDLRNLKLPLFCQIVTK